MTIDKFVSELIFHLGVKTQGVSLIENKDSVVVKVEVNDDDQEYIVGAMGTGANAIQHIIRVIFGENYPQKKLFIDINGHRDERLEKVLKLLQSVAQNVKQTGEPTMINHQLSPSERFYVHKTLSNDPSLSDLESFSVGEGSGRRVVIQLKQQNG